MDLSKSCSIVHKFVVPVALKKYIVRVVRSWFRRFVIRHFRDLRFVRPQPDGSLRSEFGLFDQILNVPRVGLEVSGLCRLLDAEGVLEDRDVAQAGDGEHVGQDGAALAAHERVKVELVPQLRHQSVHRQLGSEPGSVGFGKHDGYQIACIYQRDQAPPLASMALVPWTCPVSSNVLEELMVSIHSWLPTTLPDRHHHLKMMKPFRTFY